LDEIQSKRNSTPTNLGKEKILFNNFEMQYICDIFTLGMEKEREREKEILLHWSLQLLLANRCPAASLPETLHYHKPSWATNFIYQPQKGL
jgi:hypothetical protein